MPLRVICYIHINYYIIALQIDFIYSHVKCSLFSQVSDLTGWKCLEETYPLYNCKNQELIDRHISVLNPCTTIRRKNSSANRNLIPITVKVYSNFEDL